MLLTSNSHCRNIIIGKFLCAVWGGTSFQIFQILTMFTIMYQMNNPLLYLFSIEVFIILPLITFLMGSVILLISIILHDEKTSDFLSMLLSLFVGSAALSMYIYSNAIVNLYIYLIYVIAIVLINIGVTLVLNKIVTIGYFEVSQNSKTKEYSLRFPTWKGIIRNDKTEISMY